MITKHEAAQRFAEIMLNKLENPLLVQTNERMAIISENAFKLADAMQAEADKREDKARPEVLEGINHKEYLDAVLQDIADPCDHEWTHISKFGAEGDFYVCPCGAKSKRPQRRTK